MSSVICAVLVAIVVIAVEAFCFKRKIRCEQEKVGSLEKEKNIMLEEKQNTVAKMEAVNQKITEKWQIQMAKGPFHISWNEQDVEVLTKNAFLKNNFLYPDRYAKDRIVTVINKTSKEVKYVVFQGEFMDAMEVAVGGENKA